MTIFDSVGFAVEDFTALRHLSDATRRGVGWPPRVRGRGPASSWC
ncbi:MAG: hypothetical protein ABI083_11200 [Lapillicoccus sp.]